MMTGILRSVTENGHAKLFIDNRYVNSGEFFFFQSTVTQVSESTITLNFSSSLS